ncbi:MAG: hypothetical protein AB1546_14440 [bacterium]
MYKFKHKESFPCPAREAFEAGTRDFEDLGKYIPNVTKIEVLHHETLDDGRKRWLLKFHGDGAIPLIARAVIKPRMLRWKEEMICNPGDMTIEWSIETYYFTEHFHCAGKTHYYDRGSTCDVVVDGCLNVTLSHLPGFHDVLVRKAVQLLEPFVGRLIAPNLGKFYKAIKRRLKVEGKIR